MSRLYSTTQIVKDLLINDPKARNSDNYLYYKVCDKVTQNFMKQINLNEMRVPYFLCNLKKLNFPYFETVRRARAKLQATYPELRANAKVEAVRTEKEKAFREYAVSNEV